MEPTAYNTNTTENRLFLNNLPPNIEEQEIQDHFSKILNYPVVVRKGRNKGEKNKKNAILTLPS